MKSIRIEFFNFIAKIKLCSLDKITAESLDIPKGLSITYHAGALCTPPNSIYSINAAIEHGAEIVEFDISFRPDGTPVIIHNSSPNNSQGIFLENALEAIAKSDSCKINLDLKSTANLSAIDELVKFYGLSERVIYTGVFEDWVDAVKNQSSIPYYLNHNVTELEAANNNAAQAIADKAKDLGAIGINANFASVSKLFIDTVQSNGLLVSLWTVNKTEDMFRVLKLKPDNITTKKPHILKQIINFGG